MKLGKIVLVILGIIILFSGCNLKKEKINPEDELSETIVIYFSVTGDTKNIAKEISHYLHCGSYEIKPLDPYKPEDLKGENNRCYQEHINNTLPQISRLCPELSVYKTIILGYPIWYGEAPKAVQAYVNYDGPFPKKMRIIPFCISEKYPIGDTCNILFKNVKHVKVEEGKNFSKDVTKEEIHKWVDSLNID